MGQSPRGHAADRAARDLALTQREIISEVPHLLSHHPKRLADRRGPGVREHALAEGNELLRLLLDFVTILVLNEDQSGVAMHNGGASAAAGLPDAASVAGARGGLSAQRDQHRVAAPQIGQVPLPHVSELVANPAVVYVPGATIHLDQFCVVALAKIGREPPESAGLRLFEAEQIDARGSKKSSSRW